jgi:hypothetical protein
MPEVAHDNGPGRSGAPADETTHGLPDSGSPSRHGDS